MCPGVLLALARFIPAGAGNTVPRIISLSSSTVYPRWRGEHSASLMPIIGLGGLSPLARGTQIWGAPLMKSKRFIPAGAGNTAADSRAGHHRPVYPRWRGEHQLSDVSLAWRHGLSPLARGTPVHIRFLVARSRFIPAGAGNTDQIPVPQSTPSVYPRWRGEHGPNTRPSIHAVGLSPLARGTRTKYPSLNPRRRFIPAGAGNTDQIPVPQSTPSVYPRWRGEHLLIKWRARCVYGLSPLARGTPVVRY